MRNILPEALETAFKSFPRPGVVNLNIVGVEVEAAHAALWMQRKPRLGRLV
jgi:hypothetical protein